MYFAQGDVKEGVISLAGDVAFFATLGASKIATTSANGARAVTALRVTTIGAQGFIAGARSKQAYFAIQQGDYLAAGAYMGEALLRFIGVGKGIVDQMKAIQAARAAKVAGTAKAANVTQALPKGAIITEISPTRFALRDSTNPFLHIDGHLRSDGELTFSIITKLNGTYGVVRAKELFAAMMKHFGDRVKSIKAVWSSEIEMGDNLDAFNSAVRAGKTARQAAFDTWTGQQAKAAGFTAVGRIVPAGDEGNYIDVLVEFIRSR
jgi:hypothetical protein